MHISDIDLTEKQIKLVHDELVKGGEQNHPFHEYNVYGHTIAVTNAAIGYKQLNNIDVVKCAYLHDVGKARTKAINPKTGYDSFYNHARESLVFCEENNIDLTDMEKDVIREHDNCKSWVNGKKLRKYIAKHGDVYADLLYAMVYCDMEGQSDEANANSKVLENIKEWATN
jgi:putative nucleotidyltransferase with HDIG domain